MVTGTVSLHNLGCVAGRGNLTKREGKWCVRCTGGVDSVTGKRTTTSRTFAKKREAERFRAEFIVADGGDECEGQHFTLDQAIDNRHKAKDHDPTYRDDREAAEKLIPVEYRDIPIGRLRAADLVRLYDELKASGRSPTRAYRVHELVRSAPGRRRPLRVDRPQRHRRRSASWEQAQDADTRAGCQGY